MKDRFAEIFEQFETNKSTLTFILTPRNTNTNEINIEPFGIDAGSLQMQLLDLKTRLVEWQVHRTQEQVGRVGGPEMHAHRAAQVDSSKRNSASLGPHIRRMEWSSRMLQ
ncbi:hypothetical protein AVEN_34317-1 [Araneus ventricosus]|uniref:Uncharacterized protein n=1 Tax=Araneus ventricosus TaxID=182803 RepID=A0A4Y2G589_ARAVE|nr:hypothetical protein AVEN_34317-1 [Araneus ventricosus]